MIDWEVELLLRQIRLSSYEFSYVERLINYSKFIEYLTRNNINHKILDKKFNPATKKAIIMDILKKTIKTRQKWSNK